MAITKLLETPGWLQDVYNFLLAIVGNIPKLFYFLYTCLASLVDLCQYLFRQIAGLETMYVNNAPIEGDLVSHFIIGILTGKYPILQTLFWSFVILGIIFLFITTIIAIIKSEANPWTTENKKGEKKVANAKGKIFSTAGRALIRMAVIPITCIFACYFGGIVLNAIEGATTVSQTSSYLSEIKVTSSSDPTITYDAFKKNRNGTYFHYDIFGISLESNQISFSGIAFKTVMHSANRVRSTDWFITDVIYAPDTKEDQTGNFGVFNQAVDQESCALLIDEVFANNAILNNDYAGKKLDIEKGKMADICRPGADFFTDYDDNITQFSKFNVGLVSYYYDLWKFNIIVGFAYMILMFSMFYKIIFGLVRRLMYITVLLITLPAFCGLSPLDGESAYGEWKKIFIREFITVFGVVASMNLFLIILPYLEQISFFPSSNGVVALINKLVGMLFTLVGLSLVTEFNSLLTKIYAGDKATDLVTSGNTALQGAKELGNKSIGSIAKIGGGLAKVGGGIALAGGKGIKAGAQKIRQRKFDNNYKEQKLLEKDIKNKKKAVNKKLNSDLKDVDKSQKDYKKELKQNTEKQIRKEMKQEIRDDAAKDIEKYKQEEKDLLGKGKMAYWGETGDREAAFDEYMQTDEAQQIMAQTREKIKAREAKEKADIKIVNDMRDKKVDRQERKQYRSDKKVNKQMHNEERLRILKQASHDIEQKTKESRERLKLLKEQQVKKEEEKQEKQLKRAQMLGKVYKTVETPLKGVGMIGSGLAGGIGVGGGKKK